ncbi:NAD-dependent epimerase/dehydratase family protein [Haloarcula sp. CBA1130]|uniref:NAD(P)H-binding protein n=1 Tax=unclassified Haloarcula TaxID=2624677 RepID=UPI0012479B46|nr:MULTISPECIES: NAD(P)H-binding protein [unclassified Haloarcula]KAA9399270.1 NAD-dependent epimerase/dehydratase family protein [Haloarcula sp. CBA1129]KAA9403783.1 NAD-dependent epimerase/dehydratase family protein [Haloarcula sp. CBA1130]
MHVLVTGATGFVGGHLVPALLAAGHSVRVLVRDPSEYDPPDGVDVATGDLLDAGSFDAALAGVDVAYYLVHSMHAGADYAERDRRAARNFRRAATDAGVDRVVYLGGLGEDGETLSEHLRSRREVEFILAEGEYDLTTFRAAIIIGAGSASFRMIRELTTRLPVMLTPRWVRTDCHPIAINDVIAYLVGVLGVPDTAGETYEIGGPEVLTYAEILKRTGRLMGTGEPRIVPIPVLTPKLSAYWVCLLTDVPSSVAQPLINGLKTPVVADTDAAQAQFAVDLTPFSDAVKLALSEPQRREAAQAAAATGGAGR